MNLQQRRTATKVFFGTLVGIVFLVTAGFVIRFVISSTIISSAKGQAKTIVEQAKKQAESEKSRAESEARDAESRRAETIKSLDKQISDTGAELRKEDEQIREKKQQLKELDEKVAKASSNSDKDQQIKESDQKLKDGEQQRKDLEAKIQKLNADIIAAKKNADGQTQNTDATKALENQIKSRLAEIDKLNSELASTKTELEKIKSRKDQAQTVDRRVEDLQKIKDLEAKLRGLEKQITVTSQPANSNNEVDEHNAGMNFVKVLNQSINPLIAQINSTPAYTYSISTADSGRLSQVNYNRQLVQGALKNCQWLLWNLGSIENQKGKKYRAYMAQSATRISEPVAFDIKYDYHEPSVGFNREILNHILAAASDENVDLMMLNKTFRDSFGTFMDPHFVDRNHIDDWQLSETIAIANKQLYSLYHH